VFTNLAKLFLRWVKTDSLRWLPDVLIASTIGAGASVGVGFFSGKDLLIGCVTGVFVLLLFGFIRSHIYWVKYAECLHKRDQLIDEFEMEFNRLLLSLVPTIVHEQRVPDGETCRSTAAPVGEARDSKSSKA